MLPGLIPFLPEAGRRKLILLAHHAGRDTAGAKQGLEWVSQNNGNHCPSAKDLLI
jgi:hypothetical protein